MRVRVSLGRWLLLVTFSLTSSGAAMEDYVSQGVAYYKKAQYEQAIAAFNKALEINPRNADAYMGRGRAYELKGEYDKAIADHGKALEINSR